MENHPPLEPLNALRCVALLRLINPNSDLVICGGREKALRSLQSWLFASGANALMVGGYLTTSGRAVEADLEMTRDCGFRPS